MWFFWLWNDHLSRCVRQNLFASSLSIVHLKKHLLVDYPTQSIGSIGWKEESSFPFFVLITMQANFPWQTVFHQDDLSINLEKISFKTSSERGRDDSDASIRNERKEKRHVSRHSRTSKRLGRINSINDRFSHRYACRGTGEVLLAMSYSSSSLC